MIIYILCYVLYVRPFVEKNRFHIRTNVRHTQHFTMRVYSSKDSTQLTSIKATLKVTEPIRRSKDKDTRTSTDLENTFAKILLRIVLLCGGFVFCRQISKWSVCKFDIHRKNHLNLHISIFARSDPVFSFALQ